MGEVAEIDIEKEIRADNPSLRQVEVRVFSDALRVYHEGSRNLRANGAIVMHPRTGSPIENPYLKVQKQAGDVLARYSKRVKADRVMRLLGV